ncbi:MAG: hypothetical protein HC915_13260 [Anaerolineae bacterium]|nr:hypothetical protein [Anaerolineae bacterium]
MSYYVEPQPAQHAPGVHPWVIRLLLLGAAGIVLLMLALVILLAGHQFMTQDQISSGVAPLYGVDVSGMTRAEAIRALSSQNTYEDEAIITFTYAGRSWEYSARELGVEFDIEATVNAAYAAGRDDTPARNLVEKFRIWQEGYAVAPIIRYNQTRAQQVLFTLAQGHINQPVMDATLVLQEGQVITSNSQVGLEMDILATLDALEHEILALNTRSTIPLSVQERQPAIPDAATAAEACGAPWTRAA